jgi:hypothetical protein
MIPDVLPVVCLAIGDLSGRGDMYISRLNGMLQRHCPVPFMLTCYSDRNRHVPEGVKVVDCQQWAKAKVGTTDEAYKITSLKLHLFDAAEVPSSEFFYFDLSLVIRQNMQPLLDYAFSRPEDLVIVSDWHYSCYNSSVMRIRRGPLQTIYDAYAGGQRYEQIVKGDQDFIYEHVKAKGLQNQVALFPEGQVVSYKMTRTLNRTDPEAAQKVVEDAIIVKFHGKPKMHQVANPLYNLLKKSDYTFFREELKRNWQP